MGPSINKIILAVSNLDRSLAFYRSALGFEGDWIRNSSGNGWFFQPEDGPEFEIKQDESLPASSVILQFFVHNTQEVDLILRQVVENGGTLLRDDRHTGETYGVRIADPDGYSWEISFSQFHLPDGSTFL